MTTRPVASPAGPASRVLERAGVARSMYLEVRATSLCSSLTKAGVDVLLLKGPSTSVWLWGDTVSRTYGDIDLLVAPHHWTLAVATLQALGLQDRSGGRDETERTAHEQQFVDDLVCVDLHRYIVGMRADPAVVVEALWAHRASLELRGGTVWALDEPARALHAALHAAAGGAADPRAVEVLRRALEATAPAVWRQATLLSETVHAQAALAAGLQLFPLGEALAAELELSAADDLEVLLRASAASHASRMLLRVFTAKDAASRRRYLATGLWPSQQALRDRDGVATPAARVAHLGFLLRRLPRALLQLWQAQRRARAAGRIASTGSGR